MKEQINQLYQQALEFAYKNVNKEIWNTDNFHAIVAGKFAELIVRECAKRVDYWESRQGEHADDLLKHFGVEE